MIAKTLLASMAIMLMAFVQAEDDNVGQYCQLVQTGIKLASTRSCETYYICQGPAKPIQANCPAGTVFNKDAQRCVPASESNCIYGLSNPCQNKDKQHAPSAKGCNWYNWCVNGAIAADGTCDIGERFYAPNATCINGDCNDSNKNDDRSVCDVFPDGKFFGDFTDCRSWRKCNSMNLQKGNCENPLVFDVKTGMCLINDGNMCQRTNNVVASEGSGPPKEACTSIDQIVGDTNICSIYYICKRALNANNPNTEYKWEQRNCNNQYYDVLKRQCTSPYSASPFPGCDRCQFKSGNPYWANDVDATGAKYLTCQNGKKVSATARSCGLGNFFNEDGQQCIQGDYTFGLYARNHGACQDYGCTAKRECSLTATSVKPETTTVTTESTTAKPESTTAKPKTTTVEAEPTAAKDN